MSTVFVLGDRQHRVKTDDLRQLQLFSKNPDLLSRPAYVVKSRVSEEAFDAFLALLFGGDISITPETYADLSILSGEFGFEKLAAKLDEYKSAIRMDPTAIEEELLRQRTLISRQELLIAELRRELCELRTQVNTIKTSNNSLLAIRFYLEGDTTERSATVDKYDDIGNIIRQIARKSNRPDICGLSIHDSADNLPLIGNFAEIYKPEHVYEFTSSVRRVLRFHFHGKTYRGLARITQTMTGRQVAEKILGNAISSLSIDCHDIELDKPLLSCHAFTSLIGVQEDKLILIAG